MAAHIDTAQKKNPDIFCRDSFTKCNIFLHKDRPNRFNRYVKSTDNDILRCAHLR